MALETIIRNPWAFMKIFLILRFSHWDFRKGNLSKPCGFKEKNLKCLL